MWKKVGIYKITSPSGRVYIGQSWDIGTRRSKYKGNNLKGQIGLTRSFSKYGFDNHSFEIVHELPSDITQEVLDNYEILYCNQYKELGFKMLNMKEPGYGGKHCQETKDRISKINKGRIRTDGSWIGRKHTPESKEKMRLAKLGNKNRLGGNKYFENLIK